jgi:hypothetical protein
MSAAYLAPRHKWCVAIAWADASCAHMSGQFCCLQHPCSGVSTALAGAGDIAKPGKAPAAGGVEGTSGEQQEGGRAGAGEEGPGRSQEGGGRDKKSKDRDRDKDKDREGKDRKKDRDRDRDHSSRGKEKKSSKDKDRK